MMAVGWLSEDQESIFTEISMLARYTIGMSFEWDDKWMIFVGRFVAPAKKSSSSTVCCPDKRSGEGNAGARRNPLLHIYLSLRTQGKSTHTIPPWLTMSNPGYGSLPSTRAPTGRKPRNFASTTSKRNAKTILQRRKRRATRPKQKRNPSEKLLSCANSELQAKEKVQKKRLGCKRVIERLKSGR